MRTGSTIADPPVPVTLKERDLLHRAQRLAEKIGIREGLVEAKKDENKKRQTEIDALDVVIAAEARVVCDGFENTAQADLHFDDTLPKDDAARKLAEIAARAAKHPFVADAEKIDTCAKDGCGAQAGADVHIPPPPAEAHTWVPDGSGEGKCWACGSGADDPVHAEPKAEPVAHDFIADGAIEGVCSSCGGPRESLVHVAAAPADPNAPHAAVLGEQPEGEPKACLFCSRAVEDPIHAAGIETGNTPANETGEIAATFVCDDCIASGADVAAATHPKSEGRWFDHDARNVCPNCRQAAIEGGRWPHPFRKGHERAKRCADCNGREGDQVHLLADVPQVVEQEIRRGDPAFDFNESEQPPAVISSARAIEETPEDAADDGAVGGEAGA